MTETIVSVLFVALGILIPVIIIGYLARPKQPHDPYARAFGDVPKVNAS